MSDKARTIATIVAAGFLAAGAIGIGVWHFRSAWATGEADLQVWFYDQSEQKLYKVAKDTISPHAGTGGPKNDGVRAVVVARQTKCGDPGKRRIAYLETYTPELKKMLEDVRAARGQGRTPDKPIPSGDSDYFDKNTLVRRPDESSWHDMTTPEARRIVAEWRDWRGPDGSSLAVCSP